MLSTDFNKLSNGEKFALLEDYGTHLEAYYLKEHHRVALFEMDGFYVSVWLDQVKDRITRATAFTSYKGLDPFLSSIDITPAYAILNE